MEEKSSYKVSATVGRKYAPLVNRSRMLHEQTPKSEFPRLRASGATNYDLWLDGSIYPCRRDTMRRPSFRNVAELLEFVGEGKQGLLGYVESFSNPDSTLHFRLDEASREIARLQQQVRSLTESVDERDRMLQFTRKESLTCERLAVENREKILVNESLESEVILLRGECARTKGICDETLSRLNDITVQSVEDCVQTEVNCWIEIESEREIHEQRVKLIEIKLKSTTAMLRRREKRLQNLVKTPYGYRTIVRQRKDLASLAPRGGHFKRMLRLARSVIIPTTSRKMQSENQHTGKRQRLCGSKYSQEQTGKALSCMFSQTEVGVMCDAARQTAIGVRIANQYMDKICHKVGPYEIQEACDRNGITAKAWNGLYKTWKGAVKSTGRGLRIGLPNPHQVCLLP